MNEEFASLGNHEATMHADPHAEGELPIDAMPVNRYPLLTEPENHHFCELLQGFEQHLERWHTVLSAPEYLVEHTKDEEEETWHRGFDIVQSEANLQVIHWPKGMMKGPKAAGAR